MIRFLLEGLLLLPFFRLKSSWFSELSLPNSRKCKTGSLTGMSVCDSIGTVFRKTNFIYGLTNPHIKYPQFLINYYEQELSKKLRFENLKLHKASENFFDTFSDKMKRGIIVPDESIFTRVSHLILLLSLQHTFALNIRV